MYVNTSICMDPKGNQEMLLVIVRGCLWNVVLYMHDLFGACTIN